MPKQKDGSYILVEHLDVEKIRKSVLSKDQLKEVERLKKSGQHKKAQEYIVTEMKLIQGDSIR